MMIGRHANHISSIFRACALLSTEAAKAKKLSELPSLLSSEQIKKQMPKVYKQIMEQSNKLEAAAQKRHHEKLDSLVRSIPNENRQRLDKIDGLLNSLTLEEMSYLKFAIISQQQNIDK